MKERPNLVTMRGNPVTLLGEEPKLGEPAPNFIAVGKDLKPVEFSSFKGKVCIISAVPSLDTPVCDASTRRFNEEASKLGSDVVILTVSMDLPFAQARWCALAGIDAVVTLSDHREASFGSAYGVLIKDLRLLSRAAFVVDRQGVLRYAELVKEIAETPDYDRILQEAKAAV